MKRIWVIKTSTWILKSPTNIRSTLDEIWNSSKDSNSMKNVDMDDDGGRYTTKSLKELFFEVITEPMHSNVEKTGVDTKVWWTDFWLIIATPPPRDVWDLP